jgi:hypothetical protein
LKYVSVQFIAGFQVGAESSASTPLVPRVIQNVG